MWMHDAYAWQVHPFLHRLFTDRQIMQLPMQDYLGAWIAKVRPVLRDPCMRAWPLGVGKTRLP